MFRAIILCSLLVGCLGSFLKVHPPLLDPRIVGGALADIRNHPYQLSLQTTGHTCGASIIDKDWVITAAHCVGSSASRYKVVAGSNNKNSGIYYRLKRIIRHPNYDPQALDYDIALLQVDGQIEFNDRVKPVRLAEKELPGGIIVNVTGWGAVKQGGGASAYLMKVSLPLVDRKRCQLAYENMNQISDRMICAGYLGDGGKDSCQGDSGGPLTFNNTLYGIVSWGYGCARPDYPGVYGNVANFREWIKENSGI